MMVTTVRGTFTRRRRHDRARRGRPDRARSAEFRVKTASVDTGFGARDNHLRSADFFDAETYPGDRSCASTAIRHKRGNDYIVTADVTIRDVTRPVDFDVEFLGFFPAMDGARHAGFSAKAQVNRKDWGLDWNVALEAGGWLVGDEIKLEVEVAAQESIAVAASRCRLTPRDLRSRRGGRPCPVEVDDVELARLVLAERADVQVVSTAASDLAARRARRRETVQIVPLQKSPKT